MIKTTRSMDYAYFDCACKSPKHVIRVCFDKQIGDCWLEFQLTQWLPWYRRLVYAFGYVFNSKTPKYGMWDTVNLSSNDVEEIRNLLDHYLKYKSV